MKENKMKPKRSQKHAGASWQGKSGHSGDKSALSQATATMLASRSARPKPFAGKVFYLDLPANRVTEILENDIKELGGTVEKFFSKEIKYLVSNKREAKYVQSFRHDSPVPSPDSGQSSPHPCSNPKHPGNPRNKMQSRSQGQADSFVSSRGKSLVERVVKEKERLQMNKILANALEWGVKILYIDDVVAYVKRKLKAIASQCPAPPVAVKPTVKTEQAAKQTSQKSSTWRPRKPFIKVEDSSRHYRPLYLSLPNMPEFNLTSAPPCSPFLCEDRDQPGNRQRGHRGAKASASDDRAHGRKKNKDKKRGGYCECCLTKYDNMETHLRGERHQAFSKSDNYLVVDSLVSTMHFDFAKLKTHVKRPKCSISSVLVVPRPCGKTEPEHKGDANHTGIIKEEQQIVDGNEAFSGHELEMAAVPGCASPSRHSLACGNDGAPDRSKRRSLACKRLCRRNSVTPRAETPQPKTETSPNRGEDTRISHTQPSISAPHLLHLSEQKDSHPLDLNESDRGEDSLQHGNASPEKVNFSEGDGDHRSPAQSTSPVWQIKRKVRAYKRKRRKINTQLTPQEQAKSSCTESMLKLWELFQSSEDMDVEFLGFT